MAAANVLVKTDTVQRQRVTVKKGLVALSAIGGVVQIGHTHSVGGVAVRTNNVQGVCRSGHGFPCVAIHVGIMLGDSRALRVDSGQRKEPTRVSVLGGDEVPWGHGQPGDGS